MPGDLISGVCLMEYIKSLHFEKCFLTSKYPYIGRVFIDCCYLAKRKERKSKGREDMWVRILNRSSQQNTTYIDQKDISLKIQITQKMLGLHKKQIAKEFYQSFLLLPQELACPNQEATLSCQNRQARPLPCRFPVG